jgi:hypothetical protein
MEQTGRAKKRRGRLVRFGGEAAVARSTDGGNVPEHENAAAIPLRRKGRGSDRASGALFCRICGLTQCRKLTHGERN